MTGETVALTYAELAARLGIVVPSAKMRARRGKWRREPGNDGRTRVLVPSEVLDDAPPPLAAVDAVLLREVALAAQEAPPPAPPASDAAREVEWLRADHAAEVARLVEAHELALDILREAHAAEVARMEAAQRRDREAHAAEVERLRADQAAEIARMEAVHRRVAETRRAGLERVRAGLVGARQWLVAVTSKRG